VEAITQAVTSDNSGSNNGGSTTGSGQFIWPVSGPITDYFGPRESPTAGASSNHMGIDIGCSYGVPIAAADAGVVTVAEWGESGGNYVMIDHGNGFVTMYLHNSSLAAKRWRCGFTGTDHCVRRFNRIFNRYTLPLLSIPEWLICQPT